MPSDHEHRKRLCRFAGARVAQRIGMMLDLDRQQSEVVREILEAQLKELRIESSRADAHEFREHLHQREQVVEAVLRKLPS